MTYNPEAKIILNQKQSEKIYAMLDLLWEEAHEDPEFSDFSEDEIEAMQEVIAGKCGNIQE